MLQTKNAELRMQITIKRTLSVKLLYDICYWRSTQPVRAGDNPNPLKAIFLNRGENVVIHPFEGDIVQCTRTRQKRRRVPGEG